jgi:segregation and condensation protein B
MAERKNRKPILEAALFMAQNPVPADKLARMIDVDVVRLKELIEELKTDLQNENRGIHLIESDEGYQLRVKPEYVKYVRTLTPFKDLNRGLLRVLALVAYKQPITQSQIVKVIGNRTYEYVKILEKKGMIRTVKSGRTKALVATKGFADYFGLESPEDAKKLFESLPAEPEKGESKKDESDEERTEQPGPEVSGQ